MKKESRMKKGRQNEKKVRSRLQGKGYLKTLILGFAALYLVSMLLATYLVKCKFEDDYERTISQRAGMIQNMVRDDSRTRGWRGAEWSEEQQRYCDMILSNLSTVIDTKYQLISYALYDADGKLRSHSQNTIGLTSGIAEEAGEEMKMEYLCYILSDYLTDEEIRQLAEYQNVLYQQSPLQPARYLVLITIAQESRELEKIQIYDVRWSEDRENTEFIKNLPEEYQYYSVTAGGKTYWLKDGGIDWEWKNPSVKEDAEPFQMHFMGTFAQMPGLQYGTAIWNEWQDNEYLQNYPEKIEGGYLSLNEYYENYLDSQTKSSVSMADITYPIYFNEDTEHIYSLQIRTVTHPWMAAMDYMKYVYLGGFLLMLACMIKVAYSMNRTYEQQERLEEMRRDFTNAIAHELKTPLSVIRGFSENLKENTIAEKREYYLDKIVEQTEEMDQLVQKMCDISKLDSSQLVLKRETVDLLELIKGQAEKLQAQTAEKNLEVKYQVQGAFVFEGDRYYLEKAVFNLLSNAVEYNVQDGMIQITVEPERCSIENTGTPISEEKLAFVGNQFYSGEESRTSWEKHLGLGLYLADQIFSLHHLKLSIANVETGVRVMIEK